MPAKKSVTKGHNSDPIQALHDKLVSYQDELKLAYEKEVINVKKEVNHLKEKMAKTKEKLRKAKEKLRSAKTQYRTKPNKTNESRLEKTQISCESTANSLEDERLALAEATAYLAELALGYKKFKAQQKALNTFEKEWAKQTKVKEKVGRKKLVLKPKRTQRKTKLKHQEPLKVDRSVPDEAAFVLEGTLDQENYSESN